MQLVTRKNNDAFSLAQFLAHVRSEEAFQNMEVSCENAFRLIAWLHTLDRTSLNNSNKSLSLPKQCISQDQKMEAKRRNLFSIQHIITPQTYLLLRLYIVKLLNRMTYTDTVLGIQLIEALFRMPHLTISFGFFPDIAFTNTKDQIFLNHHLFTKAFEESPAHFAKTPSISHLALVIIHELGHILFGPTEEDADEFVNDFFHDIVTMTYTLTEEEQQQEKEERRQKTHATYVRAFRNPSGIGCHACYDNMKLSTK